MIIIWKANASVAHKTNHANQTPKSVVGQSPIIGLDRLPFRKLNTHVAATHSHACQQKIAVHGRPTYCGQNVQLHMCERETRQKQDALADCKSRERSRHQKQAVRELQTAALSAPGLCLRYIVLLKPSANSSSMVYKERREVVLTTLPSASVLLDSALMLSFSTSSSNAVAKGTPRNCRRARVSRFSASAITTMR